MRWLLSLRIPSLATQGELWENDIFGEGGLRLSHLCDDGIPSFLGRLRCTSKSKCREWPERCFEYPNQGSHGLENVYKHYVLLWQWWSLHLLIPGLSWLWSFTMDRQMPQDVLLARHVKSLMRLHNTKSTKHTVFLRVNAGSVQTGDKELHCWSCCKFKVALCAVTCLSSHWCDLLRAWLSLI